MAVQRLRVWDEVDDFLTSTPSPQEIIDFHLSESVQERLAHLLDGNRQNTLNPDEVYELEQMLAVDTFMSRLKVKAIKKLRS